MDWALCLPSPGQSSAPSRISPEAPVRNCSREAKPKGLVLHSSLSAQQVTRSRAHHPEATPGMLFYTHSSPSSSCISLLRSTSTRSVPAGSEADLQLRHQAASQIAATRQMPRAPQTQPREVV